MVQIRDVLVVKDLANDTPVGEAITRDDALSPMEDDARSAMCVRLTESISELIDRAKKDHDTNHPDGDLDYITRLSTNEFYFYTKEPLTLEEFEQIQNDIAEKLKEVPPGIQLVLGSFSVKTSDNRVMNVTPHITSGEPPEFNFIIKNYTSSIDVAYKGRNRRLMRPFDGDTSKPEEVPEITIQGKQVPFSLNNVIQSNTPGNTSFLTLVDVCLDHYMGVGKRNFKRHPLAYRTPVSHMVVSNVTPLCRRNCVGTVTHVDPIYSHEQIKAGVEQPNPRGKLEASFGPGSDFIYKVDATPCLCQRNEDRLNRQIETLRSLAIGDNDLQMNNYIEEYVNKTKDCSAEKLNDFMDDMDSTIRQLQEKINEEVLEIIDNFKQSWNCFGTSAKGMKIESAFAGVPITERMQLATSTDPSVEKLKSAIAAHQYYFRDKNKHLDASGHVDERKAASCFRNMKNKFKEAIQQTSSAKDFDATEEVEAGTMQPK